MVLFEGPHLDLSIEHPMDNLPSPINNQSDTKKMVIHSLVIQARIDPQEAHCEVAILDLGNSPSMVIKTEDSVGMVAIDSWPHIGISVWMWE